MNTNIDFDEWRQLWQGDADGGSIAAELRARAVRETRRQRFRLLASVLVTVVIGGGAAARAMSSAQIDDVVLAVEAWLFIAVSWAGFYWIDRGTWRPLGDTTSAFLDVAIRRCRSAFTGTLFIALMYVVQLAAVLSLKAHYSAADPATLLQSWPMAFFGWIGVPILAAASLWYIRRKMVELRRLIALRQDVAGA